MDLTQPGPKLPGDQEEEEGDTNTIYENVSLFNKGASLDPFGEDFEEAIKEGTSSRVRSTADSLPSSEAVQARQAFDTPPGVQARKAVDTPPVPGKRCSRSTSQISRCSTGSNFSDRSQHSIKKYSYDEVSLSENFNKPVVRECPKEKVEDIFSSISFSSPLKEIDLPVELGSKQSSTDGAKEWNMNSLESNLSNLSISERENPTNSTSIRTEVGEEEAGNEDDITIEDPYENIEEVKAGLARLYAARSEAAPEPPPRNAKEEYASLEKESPPREENIYSEVRTASPARAEPETLLDRLMRDASAVPDTADCPPLIEGVLGAVPKHQRNTIDIRSTVYEWYEQAVQEVERDLSLDISHLEQIASNKKQPRSRPQYEHISMAVSGHPMLDGEMVVPQPTFTLLRDFDPCFQPLADDCDDDAPDDDELQAGGSNTAAVIAAAPAAAVCSAPASPTASVESVSSATVIAAVGSSCAVSSSEVNLSTKNSSSASSAAVTAAAPVAVSSTKKKAVPIKSKFPPLDSPKKINFGPPKPPRHFDYVTLPSDESGQQRPSKGTPAVPDRKVPSGQRKLSPRQLFDKLRFDMSGEERSPVLRQEEATRSESCSDKTSKACYDNKNSDFCEEEDCCGVNMYVRHGKEKPSVVENIYAESTMVSSPRPSDSPPPPLPSSLPPSVVKTASHRHQVTMYENVWIDESSKPTPPSPPSSLPPALPAVPPRSQKPRKDSFQPDTSFSSNDSQLMNNSLHNSPVINTHRKLSETGSAASSRSHHSKQKSIDSQSSVSTTDSGSTTRSASRSFDSSAGEPRDQTDSAAREEEKMRLSENCGNGKVRKLPSTRSFSVANLNTKLNKLPELANSVKRRMSGHIKPKISLTSDAHPAAVTVHNSDDDDDDDDMVDDIDSAVDYSQSTIMRRGTGAVLDSGGVGRLAGSRNHTGAVYILSRKRKQFLVKWCILGAGSLRWFNEQTSLAIPKETIQLCHVFSVTKRVEKHIGPSGQELYCFDVAALNSKGKYSVNLVGLPTAGDRDGWADRIVQCLTTRLSSYNMFTCKRIGWCYLKLGFAGEWIESWLCLSGRQLTYSTADTARPFDQIDLKRTKEVFLRKDNEHLDLPADFSKHPVLVCDFNDRSLYLLVGALQEYEAWKAHISEIAFTNNNVLSDQQVTHEEIPVIVDKCIKFVYSHGVMTEGIYRLAGVNTKINRLLSEFRNNAWAVQISRENYSEHDVANVLKRFIRQLNEPLLTAKLRDQFIQVVTISDEAVRIERYRELLGQLPAVNYNTVRKLMGHLNIVAGQMDKNLMPVINLAPLWGPNILTVDTQEARGEFGTTSEESDVCADLITHFSTLFHLDSDELEKEKRMLEVLEKINFPTPSSIKRSGDIKMWIYLETRTGGRCVGLSLHPCLTAGEAIQTVGKEAGYSQEQLNSMVLHEVVLREFLERPIHYTEKILDVTLRWGTWEDEDRMNNYLLLKKNAFYAEALPCAVPPLSIFSELQYSDNKPKSKFVKLLFSVSNANITCYKEDKTGLSSEVSAWPVEELIWYIGCEKKRGAPYNLNLTILSKQEPTVRTKEAPLFGRVLSFHSRELFTKWIAALLVAEYQTDVVPNHLVVI